jgi:hypothetical protein
VHVDLKTNGYKLSALDRDRLDQAIDHLDKLTSTYPNRRVHITIDKFGHSEECQVRVVLTLASRRLVAMDRAAAAAPAAQRCVDILSQQISLAKERIHRGHGERQLRRAKEEAGYFDLERLRIAHIDADYEAFRDALGQVDEMVEAEIGRRLKFHPDAEALLGGPFVIQDIVEDVLIYAFENYMARPENVPFREWLLSNIDLCIDELVRDAQRGEPRVRPSDFAA